jgi:crotonobetainyl-CoA:carnitine CoA-transferase CaiB-like acyl-CoA transferase
MAYLPLSGIKVLDMARLIPGDLATRRLADLGADVVKVEQPGIGDYLRLMEPRIDGEGVMHWCFNRNKQSIDVDIKTEQGMALFHELADVADVIVEVSVPGRLEQAGLDFEALRKRRPELVICSITGFGQDGAWNQLPSHGMNMDALAACMLTTERHGRKAIDFSFGTSLASEFGAVNAALAITAAVLHAKTSGEGAWIDISCWDAAVETKRIGLVQQAAHPGQGSASSAEDAALYAIYKASDTRELVFCAIEQRFWQRFCEGIDRPDLIDRWQGEKGGVDFRPGDEELRGELDAIFATADSATWDRRFTEWSIPGCLVIAGDQLLDTQHFTDRALVERGDGPMPALLDPIKWIGDGRPGERAAPPPSLGENRKDVLARWLKR